MRTSFFACILASALLGAAAFAAPARAQASAPVGEPSITARQLSRAVVVGIRVGAEKAQRAGQLDANVAACVMSIEESALGATYEKIMRRRLSDKDIRSLDAFYGSEAGRRFFRWTLNQLRTQNELPIVDPIELGAEERAHADKVHNEGPGRILNEITSDAGVSAELDQAIQALLQPCTG